MTRANIVQLHKEPTTVQDAHRGPMLHLLGGYHVYPLTLRPAEIRGPDIVRSLSRICRFGGGLNEHYSVAQHSCMVADLVPSEYEAAALLHDAAEAYIGDIVRPLKQWLDATLSAVGVTTITEIELGITKSIYARAGLPWSLYEESKSLVKSADNIACVTEARDLLGEDFRPFGFPEPLTHAIDAWGANYAEQVFGVRLRRVVGGLFA